MTAAADWIASSVVCPDCRGGGEIGYEPRDWWQGSGVNVITRECRLCCGEGRLDPDIDASGEPITWNGCQCDVGRACNYPPCVMRNSPEQYLKCGVFPPGPVGWDDEPRVWSAVLVRASGTYGVGLVIS